MSRHFDSRDSGFDYQGQDYRRSEPYPPASTSAPYPPPPHRETQSSTAPPPGPPPPQVHHYYQSVAPPAPAPYSHQPPPPVHAGAYYATHPPQWSEHPPPLLPYHDSRRYPDAYGLPPPPEYALRGPPPHPAYQQYPAQVNAPFTANPFPNHYGPRTRRRPKEQARVACSNCKKDHVSCDNGRPCQRCVNANKPDECLDVPPKKRGRPRVRPDPYAAAQAPAAESSNAQIAPLDKQTSTTWSTAGQSQVPRKDDKETSRPSTKDATNSSTTSEGRYPPSSWNTSRSHFSTPDSAYTTAGASAPLSRSATMIGPRPSPPSLTRLDTAKVGSVKPDLAASEKESRTSVTTSPVAHRRPASKPLSVTSPGLQPERPATTGAVKPSRFDSSPSIPLRTAGEIRDYQETGPAPPLHNPPMPSQLDHQGQIASRGPQLPPLSSLHSSIRLSPERRPQADSTPVYDFSPTPRRRLSNQGHHSHRFSWHEQSSHAPLLGRSPSRSGGSPVRRRSVDARTSHDPAAQAVAGQRRPSQSDHNEGQRKRQRLTLNEIMRND